MFVIFRTHTSHWKPCRSTSVSTTTTTNTNMSTSMSTSPCRTRSNFHWKSSVHSSSEACTLMWDVLAVSLFIIINYINKLLIISFLFYEALKPQPQFSSESGIVRRRCSPRAGLFNNSIDSFILYACLLRLYILWIIFQNVPEFNEAVPSSRPTSVDLKVEVKQKDPEHLQLKVCAVWVKVFVYCLFIYYKLL